MLRGGRERRWGERRQGRRSGGRKREREDAEEGTGRERGDLDGRTNSPFFLHFFLVFFHDTLFRSPNISSALPRSWSTRDTWRDVSAEQRRVRALCY
eukprot:2134645-Rhodomonas_salina.1